MIFSPWGILFFFVFVVTIIVLFGLLQVGIISYAFARIGMAPQNMLLLLVGTLIGAFINIPLKKLKEDCLEPKGGSVYFFGVRYRVPSPCRERTTVLAVNVGGAVIPAVLSIYLMIRFGLYLPAFLGTAVVTLVTYKLAQPIKGVGIGIPLFIPPLFAALCGLLFSEKYAPAVAYISGSMGTLIGADILNLKRIPNLGAPVASIGGAGTFDGVFLTGIIAVLLAA